MGLKFWLGYLFIVSFFGLLFNFFSIIYIEDIFYINFSLMEIFLFCNLVFFMLCLIGVATALGVEDVRQ